MKKLSLSNIINELTPKSDFENVDSSYYDDKTEDEGEFINKNSIDYLKKLSQQIGPGDRVHISKTPLNKNVLRNTNQSNETNFVNKPKGFWFGIGPQWIQFVVSDVNFKYAFYAYKLEIDFTKMLNVVDNGIVNEYVIPSNDYNKMIDWVKVSKDFDGAYTLKGHGMYVDLWDVPSGCVWNIKAIKHIAPINIK